MILDILAIIIVGITVLTTLTILVVIFREILFEVFLMLLFFSVFIWAMCRLFV